MVAIVIYQNYLFRHSLFQSRGELFIHYPWMVPLTCVGVGSPSGDTIEQLLIPLLFTNSTRCISIVCRRECLESDKLLMCHRHRLGTVGRRGERGKMAELLSVGRVEVNDLHNVWPLACPLQTPATTLAANKTSSPLLQTLNSYSRLRFINHSLSLFFTPTTDMV